MISGCPKGYVLVQQELEEDDKHDGQKFGNGRTDAQFVYRDIQDEIAQQHACQPDGKEYDKTLHSLVLHPEVVRTVEQEAGRDAHQHTDAVGYQVVSAQHLRQQKEAEKVECGRERANQPIQNEMVETMVNTLKEAHGNQLLHRAGTPRQDYV